MAAVVFDHHMRADRRAHRRAPRMPLRIPPPPGGFGQRPGDQHVAIGGVVGIGHRIALPGIVFPREQAGIGLRQIGLCPIPDRLERGLVTREHREHQAIALPFAMADPAVAGIDDAAGRIDERAAKHPPQAIRRRLAAFAPARAGDHQNRGKRSEHGPALHQDLSPHGAIRSDPRHGEQCA